jgi:hypothetical protein
LRRRRRMKQAGRVGKARPELETVRVRRGNLGTALEGL